MRRPINILLKLIIPLILLIIPVWGFGQDDLNEYMVIAGENNPELKSLFQEYLASLERLPQVSSLPDPKFAFGVFLSPVETRVGAQRATFGISQMFPWFGQLKAQEDAASKHAQSRFERFEDAKNRLYFEVKSNYYNQFVLNSAIDITEDLVELLITLKDLANSKFEAGTVSFVDVLRVDIELAKLQNDLDLMRDQQIPLRAQFEELLNTELDTDIIFPDTLWKDTLNLNKSLILDTILANNPQLKSLDYQMSAFEKEALVADKMGKPSFNIGLNYVIVGERTGVDIPDNGKDAFLLPQVGISLPIYRKKYTSRIKEKQVMREAVQFKKENKVNELNTILENRLKDYYNANRKLELFELLTDLSLQSLDILVIEYSSAGNDFDEVLQMERQLLKFQLEYIKAQADLNISIAYIKYLMGI